MIKIPSKKQLYKFFLDNPHQGFIIDEILSHFKLSKKHNDDLFIWAELQSLKTEGLISYIKVVIPESYTENNIAHPKKIVMFLKQ